MHAWLQERGRHQEVEGRGPGGWGGAGVGSASLHGSTGICERQESAGPEANQGLAQV